MLTWLVIAAIGVMQMFPHSLAGRALRRLLVDKPAAGLNRLRRGHLALVFLLAVMLAAALAMGREGFVVAAQTPEIVAWFAAFDIATYVDVFAAAVILAAAVRLKPLVGIARLALARLRRTGPRAVRAPRRHSHRQTPPADSDDEAWPALPALG